jgi:ribose 5-phosphate isomerase A
MDLKKKMAGEKAAGFIEDGMVVGLGTGSTAYYMIKRLGELVADGLFVKAVTTSHATEKLAGSFNIPMFSVDEVAGIDLLIDGVDEIDRNFNAIKGGGGALFREKLIAKLSKRIIWIMDDSKYVDAIGAFPLPVEILPFGYTHTLKKLQKINLNPVLRLTDDEFFITDNGNYIVDLHLEKPINIGKISEKLNSIIGVLETGLFVNMGERIIAGTKNHPKIIENKSHSD